MQPFSAFHLFEAHDNLREGLVARGVNAVLYQDGTSGGLLCVKVPLTADDSEYAPSVLISTEGTLDGSGNQEWVGALDAVGADEQYDLTLDVRQRLPFNETEDDVARKYAVVLRLLVGGGAAIDVASSASRQHHIDTGRYLLKGEAYV